MCVVGPLPSAASVYTSRVMQGFAQREETASGQAAEESWKTRTKARPEGPVNGEGPVYKDFLRALCSEQSVWKPPEHVT